LSAASAISRSSAYPLRALVDEALDGVDDVGRAEVRLVDNLVDVPPVRQRSSQSD
jgi:hypothetical protein